MEGRKVQTQYRDPLELVWLSAANRLGWRVVRESSAYASWDGEGTLTLAPPEELDADDTVAQMVLHEICHALVAGPRGMKQLDWGLDNASSKDLVQEHACNRLQAALAGPYGLREFLAVTTEHRSYYDALPREPLADGDDPAIALAQRGSQRAELAPFAAVLAEALEATARFCALVRPWVPPDSLWHRARLRHRSGLLLPREGPASEATCGDCAWLDLASPSAQCRQSARAGSPGVRVERTDPACERFELRFGEQECGRCGACCREGFDLVPVHSGDPVLAKHPEMVAMSPLGPALLRPNGQCVALVRATPSAAYRCRIYTERPVSCREFELGGDACLVARRRVGLSR